MTWTDAERYYRTLRAVEDALEIFPDGPLPWNADCAAVFGTPERLRLALLTRWRTIVEAQGEDRTVADLVTAHPGLARLAGAGARAGAGPRARAHELATR